MGKTQIDIIIEMIDHYGKRNYTIYYNSGYCRYIIGRKNLSEKMNKFMDIESTIKNTNSNKWIYIRNL